MGNNTVAFLLVSLGLLLGAFIVGLVVLDWLFWRFVRKLVETFWQPYIEANEAHYGRL